MIVNTFRLLRIHQWLKNLMLFFPPFLGGTFFSDCLVPRALLPFIAFCTASSATYILNDLFDKENDRHHPEKRTRPIASGGVSAVPALLLVAVLLVCSVLLAWNVSSMFLLMLAVYFVVSLAYSVKLKEIVLVDIFCISAGFLLRLQAGGVAFNVPISEWLFLSVFLLSVFLSTGKRLAEKQRLGDVEHHHRKALLAYPKGFLDGIMYMTGSAVLVTYAMYVISRHSPLLLYSVPLCCFGLLRYILRVQTGKGGDPTESLTQDVPLLIVGVVWAFLVGWGIYGR
ncbi:MAG: decaprenyl-phosphate phosphoribosyltransferase [Desulfuromonadales bacterium]|nr:decaprenyl-phosphate phosphoribosyltransferase [Desulfuromonadales bacterium]